MASLASLAVCNLSALGMWLAGVLTLFGSLQCHTQAVSRHRGVYMCSIHIITQGVRYPHVYAYSFSGEACGSPCIIASV